MAAPAQEPFAGRVLSDSVAEVDSFGSHTRVAQAIAQLILKSDSPTRSVALTGHWGSGKSSVIKFLTEQLRPLGQIPLADIFVFDAWTHQGDPLRRSFLEKFIEHADAQVAEKSVEWRRELDLVTGRIERSTVTARRALTKWGLWVLIAFLVCPALGGAFLSKYDPKTAFWTSNFSWLAIGAYVLPFIVAWFAYQFDGHEDLASALVRDIRQETDTETVRTKEASSIDFRNLFEKIAKPWSSDLDGRS